MRMTHVRRIVAEYYDLTKEEMLQISRKHEFVLPRQIAMYFCNKLTDASLNEIARFFSRKDHTTVWHAITKIEALRLDSEWDEKLSKLEELLLGSAKNLNSVE